MKKKAKHIIVTLTASVAVVASAVLIYVWPMLSMTPYPTSIIIGTDIISVQNMKNSLYFLPTADGSYIAVDAGSNQTEIAEAMSEQGIDSLSVAYVLLTHTDSDHVAALSLFSNAEIIICEDEEQMIDGTTKRNIVQRNSLPDDVMSRLRYVGEGETLTLSQYNVTCFKAPGHTSGSMAYLVNDEYLFTGDALGINKDKAIVHPYTMDKQTAESSISKLLDISEDVLIFTAHYGIYPAAEILR